MKQYLKFFALSAVVLLLAGCTDLGNKKEETTVAETTTVETTQAPESEQTEQETTQAEVAKEPTEDAVVFKFFVNGEEQPDLSYFVEDAEGMSVKEAMESQDKVPFNFNEEEGVIDSINNIENNYETWETWAYLYNGLYAELGVISQKLQAGDTIHWYYGTVDQIPTQIVPAEEEEMGNEDMAEESVEETAAE